MTATILSQFNISPKAMTTSEIAMHCITATTRTRRHCTESYRPFECWWIENCELRNNLKLNVIWERGASKRPLIWSSPVLGWMMILHKVIVAHLGAAIVVNGSPHQQKRTEQACYHNVVVSCIVAMSGHEDLRSIAWFLSVVSSRHS